MHIKCQEVSKKIIWQEMMSENLQAMTTNYLLVNNGYILLITSYNIGSTQSNKRSNPKFRGFKKKQ